MSSVTVFGRRTYINIRTYVLQTYFGRWSLIQTVPHTDGPSYVQTDFVESGTGTCTNVQTTCTWPDPASTTYVLHRALGGLHKKIACNLGHSDRLAPGQSAARIEEGGGREPRNYAMPRGEGGGGTLRWPPSGAASRQIQTSDHQYRGTTSKDTKGRQRSDVVASAQ